MTLFDPQWLLVAWGLPRVALKLPLVLFVGLAATLAVSALSVRDFDRRWSWYGPLLCYVLVAAVAGVFAPNIGRARDGVQFMILFWILTAGTAALVTTVRDAERLILAFGIQFLWWGIWGARSGRVSWDPLLANLDGFGGWMVIGVGFCSFLGLATDDKRLKRVMFLTAFLCAVGVVASFARGAFLSAVIVAGLVWLRYPRKGVMLAWGVACAVVVSVAATTLHGGAYWAEIMSAFTEGTEAGTGQDRWDMWRVGWKVFLERPLLGAGPENWGIYAATHFEPGEIPGRYSMNPVRLYGRSLHSSYVQVVSEMGILGVLAFIWILQDFWRRNALLRTPRAAAVWAGLGGSLRLRPVALGLEAAMVGWMGAGAFYSMAGSHWFYVILALNLLLHQLVVRQGAIPAQARPAGVRRRVPTAIQRQPGRASRWGP